MVIGTDHLTLSGTDKTKRSGCLCILLAHNEGNLLKAFFDHYRRFGDMTFIVVDDRSTDGSAEYLAAQPDVTVLVPNDGSTYAEHKREWRGQVLDRVADNRWVLAPDADEHLVWHGAPGRSFAAMIDDLEAENADALYAIMLDMYADRPLSEHVFRDGTLSQSFPLFDDPRIDPCGTWMERGATRFLRSWPTPQMSLNGGMRMRLMNGGSGDLGAKKLGRRLFGRLRDHRSARGKLIRRFTKHAGIKPPISLTKIPLVKWRRGLRFYGGAHCLNRKLQLASERGVLLHYPVTRGVAGLHHVVSRGQHMANSGYYSALLEVAQINPKYYGTRELKTIDDLQGILLPPRRPK